MLTVGKNVHVSLIKNKKFVIQSDNEPFSYMCVGDGLLRNAQLDTHNFKEMTVVMFVMIMCETSS